MNRCPMCKGESLVESKMLHRVSVGDADFEADLPCLRCQSCSEPYLEAADLARFGQAVARALLRLPPTGPAMKWVRKRAELTASELAELLDVTAETISHWETGKFPVPRAVWAVLFHLFSEQQAQQTQTRDRLLQLARAAPRPPGPLPLDLLAMTA